MVVTGNGTTLAVLCLQINRKRKGNKMQNLENLMQNLPMLPNLVWNRETQEFVDGFVAPRGFIRDGMLFISGDEGDDAMDYYGDYRGGYPWINPVLEQFAENNNAYWEWHDGGSIVLCLN